MKHPPYHLRINKAVDRFLLVDILRILRQQFDLSEYTYFGFGGPFLDDFRLLHEQVPELSFCSIESDSDTFNRQKFHKFTKKIALTKSDFTDFIRNQYEECPSVFWLDYTNLEYSCFTDFMSTLEKVAMNSVVRITLRADKPGNPYSTQVPRANLNISFDQMLDRFKDRFISEFGDITPANIRNRQFRSGELPSLLNEMVQISASQALPSSLGVRFQPLHTSYYNDNTPMISVTGVVIDNSEVPQIRNLFRFWPFKRLDWEPPEKIDVPPLSVKERFKLEKLLPTTSNTGRTLARTLGYSIGNGDADNLERLQQYGKYHNLYPYFGKLAF